MDVADVHVRMGLSKSLLKLAKEKKLVKSMRTVVKKEENVTKVMMFVTAKMGSAILEKLRLKKLVSLEKTKAGSR